MKTSIKVNTKTIEELWKDNLLKLVKEHRAKCNSTCTIMLSPLLSLVELAKIELTDEERSLFF